MKKEIIFINSHPIQYFAPMYKRMNEMGVKTTCWYCSDVSIKGAYDRQFGVEVKWDIPLLEGYSYKFFKNYSWKSSPLSGFFGLINIKMIRELFKTPKSVIVVHGWHYFTLFCFIMLGKSFGHTVCLRCDVPFSHENLKEGLLQRFKRFVLKFILFPRIHFFLYIGEQNRSFYKSYGIADSRLLSCPYAVDNDRFRDEYSKIINQIPAIKEEIGIPRYDKVIIFSAKYISKKRPLDVIRAFNKLKDENLWLIMIGEGELRPQMEALIKTKNIKNVILTGFVNQSKISHYYAIGNLFVMCSGLGENWGLSVNEAMNFNLPLILSDLSGCAEDLVKEGVNGYIFKTGDVDDLAIKMRRILRENTLTNATSSIDIVEKYSYETVTESFSTLV